MRLNKIQKTAVSALEDIKARDIIGYSVLQFVVHVPVVLFLVWVLNYTF